MHADVERSSLLARVLGGCGRALAHLPRLVGLVLALAWMRLIWFVSSVSPPNVGHGSAAGAVIGNLAHAPEFGLFTLWLCLLLPRRDRWIATEEWRLRIVWLAVFVYACVDEFHQALTPHRDPSVCDVLTDITAAACVLLCVRYAGGAHADSRKLARTLAWGLVACIVCACIASFIPALAPQWEWL